MSDTDIFRQRLVSARRLRDLNQEELAKRAGLQPAAVSHFETGARKPSFDNLRKLSQALTVSIDYLMGRTDDPEGIADATVAFRDQLKGLTSDQRDLAFNFIEMLKKQKADKN
jgi:transcriptional regulator with XRE-family HTH domain